MPPFLSVVARSAEEHQDVVDQCGQRTQCRHNVSVGGGAQGAGGLWLGGAVCDAGLLQPCRGAAACIDLHREGDEAEQRGEREKADPDEQERGEYLDGQDAGQQYPLNPLGSERYCRNKGGAHLQRPVGHGMLHGMAAFVGCHCGGCHRAPAVDAFAQVDGLGRGIVMVGQMAWNGRYTDVVDAVVAQHFLCYLPAGQAACQGDARIGLEFSLKIGLHQIAYQCDADE